jgi:FixJ family two-component response regulator
VSGLCVTAFYITALPIERTITRDQKTREDRAELTSLRALFDKLTRREKQF